MQDQHLEQLTLGHCPLRKDFCVWRQIQAPFRFMSIHQMLGMGAVVACSPLGKPRLHFPHWTGQDRCTDFGVSALPLELEDDLGKPKGPCPFFFPAPQKR